MKLIKKMNEWNRQSGKSTNNAIDVIEYFERTKESTLVLVDSFKTGDLFRDKLIEAGKVRGIDVLHTESKLFKEDIATFIVFDPENIGPNVLERIKKANKVVFEFEPKWKFNEELYAIASQLASNDIIGISEMGTSSDYFGNLKFNIKDKITKVAVDHIFGKQEFWLTLNIFTNYPEIKKILEFMNSDFDIDLKTKINKIGREKNDGVIRFLKIVGKGKYIILNVSDKAVHPNGHVQVLVLNESGDKETIFVEPELEAYSIITKQYGNKVEPEVVEEKEDDVQLVRKMSSFLDDGKYALFPTLGTDGKLYYGLTFDYRHVHGIGKDILETRESAYREIYYTWSVGGKEMTKEFFEKLLFFIMDGQLRCDRQVMNIVDEFINKFSRIHVNPELTTGLSLSALNANRK